MSAQPTYLLCVAPVHGRPTYEAYPNFTAAHEAAEAWTLMADDADDICILTIFDGQIDGEDRL